MHTLKLACALTGCAILIAASSPEARASASAQLLYEQKCGRCHAAVEPAEYSPEEWPGVVRSMKAQAALSRQEYGEIVAYLTAEAREGGESSASSGPVIGGYLYTEYFQSQEKTRNYDIRYLAFHASGWVTEKVHYFGEFELEHGGTGGTNTFVEQAFLEYWFLPNLGLRIGALLTPFNRFDEFHDPGPVRLGLRNRIIRIVLDSIIPFPLPRLSQDAHVIIIVHRQRKWYFLGQNLSYTFGSGHSPIYSSSPR